MDNSQPPLVSGPEPTLLDRLRAAWSDMRSVARAPAERSLREPAKPAEAKRRKPAKDNRPRTPEARAAEGPDGSSLLGRVGAIVLIAPWTAFLVFPVAADFLGDPYLAISRVIAAYPELAPLEIYSRSLLWQAPTVAAWTFALRVVALSGALRNGLTAGGWFVIAMLIDGASWLIWGREHMGAAGFPAAEQKAALHLMIVFAIFSLTVWSLYGGSTKRGITKL